MATLEALETSKVWRYLGIEIITNDKGQSGVKINNTENLKQVHGNLHGGIIATAIDTAMAVTVNEAIGPEQYAVTVELKVNYLLPVADSDIYAFATLVKNGKRLFMATVQVYDEEQNIVAIGSGTFSIINKRRE